MAGSSSNSSFIVQIREEYPYPSHVHLSDYVTVKLSGKDRYNAWKTQILCLLVSHDMLGFINGKFVRPTGNSKRKVGNLEAWTRSDALVKSWILGSVLEEATMYVVDRLMFKIPNAYFTAKDLWDELECIYGPEILQEAREIITEEDAKSEDKSKEEKTGQNERYKIERKEAASKKLYKYTVKRDSFWLNRLLNEGEVSVTDKITNNGNTALHVAVGTSKDPLFFMGLLGKTPENISLTDLKNSDGSTLLHIAAIVGNTPAAKILVERYPDMLIQEDNVGQTPLAVALSNMHTETVECLLDNIKTDDIRKDTLFSGTSGDELLVLAISSKDFQLAMRLLKSYSTMDSDAMLMAIAKNFPPELSFWERRVAEFEDTPILNVTVFPFVKRRVQTRYHALRLCTKVCLLIQRFISSSLHKNYYTNPILEATRQNSLEVVKEIVRWFPNAFWSASEDGHNVIQYAVINRSEKIYNLLYEMSEHKNVYKTSKDSSGNNLLHLAARLAPAEKLNLISGAALQIQYELQWYKEVERFVCSLNITQKNSFGETPQMVFTKTHKELLTEGERWMKATAESYTITAALITTIVFAAAITVPGGNNQDTGVPIFTNNPAFTIFAVSDAISLFTAVMSLLMFLSILTTRFAEEDFLYKLPRKLIIGLVTLFVSTTTMIIAFGAAWFIVFGQKIALLLIPIGALAGLTITFFVAFKFPLLVDLMRATYGRSIFEFEDTPILNVTVFPFVKRRVQTRYYALRLCTKVCLLIQRFISSSLHKNYYTNPILEATRQNSPMVVKRIVRWFPNAFWSASEDGHNIIQYAVINRSEKIYNLLYEMSEHKNVYKTSKDSSGNNLLHLAARLAPAEKLNLISGAAFQIQYELQWYKEVERFVCSLCITQKNSFGETPQMVFTKTHKELLTGGERWMKATAESYTITAALITTIVFAAAITVPGGNNQDTGVPIFTNNLAFTIFAVSDAISLFTAVMSLLMFLSILTTRFAEEDFLYKLPRKLIIGLVTLFVSTTTMIIAFGAALFIVFGQKNAWFLIPIGALTGLTITFFVALQFPLVVDLMRATYGRSIFGRNEVATYDRLVPFNI